MIKSAKEMRETVTKKELYKKGYIQAVESVMKSIETASKMGLRKTCFSPRMYHYETANGFWGWMNFYDEVKEEFKEHGYTFKPTGYVDGVWQQSEDICW